MQELFKTRRTPPIAGTACLLLLAMTGGACALSHEPRLVTFPQLKSKPVLHIAGVFDYRTAIASIDAILRRDLGFEAFPVTYAFYPSRTAFEGALVQRGHAPAFARTTARTMIAVGGHRGVLINDAALSAMEWPDRTLLLAHELTHSLQYELAGGRRGTSDQWLREGFADWASIRTLERLDGGSMRRFKARRERELRAAGRTAVPALGEMTTFQQWVEIGATRGAAAYAKSFLAVDLLIERHGVASVLDYFTRFAESEDRTGNFEAAFGRTLNEFDGAVQATLWPR